MIHLQFCRLPPRGGWCCSRPLWRGLCYGIRCEPFPAQAIWGLSRGSEDIPHFAGLPLSTSFLIRARHLLERVDEVFPLLEHPHAISRFVHSRTAGAQRIRACVWGCKFVFLTRSSASSEPRACLVPPVSVTLSLTSSGSRMRFPRVAVLPLGYATAYFCVLVRTFGACCLLPPCYTAVCFFSAGGRLLPSGSPYSSGRLATSLSFPRWALRAAWPPTGG